MKRLTETKSDTVLPALCMHACVCVCAVCQCVCQCVCVCVCVCVRAHAHACQTVVTLCQIITSLLEVCKHSSYLASQLWCLSKGVLVRVCMSVYM